MQANELFSTAIKIGDFAKLVFQSFGNPAGSTVVRDIEQAISEVRGFIITSEDRPTLTDTDLVILTIFAAMMSDGFDFNDQHGNLKYVYQIRQSSAVFIDEVQDFTEIEVLLMGLTATSAYNQITLSGDRCQRLQSAGAVTYDDLFPWVPRNQTNRPIFLDHNFRQRPELAELSRSFRALMQNDSRRDSETEELRPATVYKYSDHERMSELILERIRSVPKHATIAVITPTFRDAQIWFDLLEEELGAYHRPALISRRDDLTRRFNVHFTDVRETKGLEFNVVIIPDLGSFALDSAIGRNQAYVALSRAKHALIIGCATDSVGRREIISLERNDVICIRPLPSH